MNKIRNKLMELFQICVYSFAVFGAAMFLAYILILNTSERSYIPMEGINQLICYIGGATIAIILCLSDIVLEKIPLKIRIPLFFIVLYVMGILYFKFRAFNGTLSSGQFLMFSIWIVYMSFLVLLSWFVYSAGINNKYNKCLSNYKKKFNN